MPKDVWCHVRAKLGDGPDASPSAAKLSRNLFAIVLVETPARAESGTLEGCMRLSAARRRSELATETSALKNTRAGVLPISATGMRGRCRVTYRSAGRTIAQKPHRMYNPYSGRDERFDLAQTPVTSLPLH
jgi:hypothetical protein